MTTTFMANAQNIKREWYVVDAEGQTLGRLASQIAAILRGKHKPTFTPHVDCGDHVVLINAEKIHLTGNKLKKKMYFHHSRYPGGLSATPYGQLLKEKPTRALEEAIRGMLPHTRLGRQMYRKLKVYAGPSHPHEAQMPKTLVISPEGVK